MVPIVITIVHKYTVYPGSLKAVDSKRVICYATSCFGLVQGILFRTSVLCKDMYPSCFHPVEQTGPSNLNWQLVYENGNFVFQTGFKLDTKKWRKSKRLMYKHCKLTIKKYLIKPMLRM